MREIIALLFFFSLLPVSASMLLSFLCKNASSPVERKSSVSTGAIIFSPSKTPHFQCGVHALRFARASPAEDGGWRAYRRAKQTTDASPWSHQSGMIPGRALRHNYFGQFFQADGGFKSQANAFAFVFLSGLILSQTLIIAHNFTNAPFQNGSAPFSTPTGFAVSLSGNMSLNESENGSVSGIPVSSFPVSDMPSHEGANDTFAQSAPAGNETGPVDFGAAQNYSSLNESFLLQEETPNTTVAQESQNSTIDSGVPAASGNDTVDPFLPGNFSNETAGEPTANIASNSTAQQGDFGENVSVPPVDVPANISIPGVPSPVLELSVSISGNIKRGEPSLLVVNVVNNGSADAKNVQLSLDLPPGVSVVSGDTSVGEISAGASVGRQFTVSTSYGAGIGANKIKVRVSYEW